MAKSWIVALLVVACFILTGASTTESQDADEASDDVRRKQLAQIDRYEKILTRWEQQQNVKDEILATQKKILNDHSALHEEYKKQYKKQIDNYNVQMGEYAKRAKLQAKEYEKLMEDYRKQSKLQKAEFKKQMETYQKAMEAYMKKIQADDN